MLLFTSLMCMLDITIHHDSMQAALQCFQLQQLTACTKKLLC